METKNGSIELIVGNMFSEKCLGINTPILMFNGTLKMVQDIIPTDILMGDDSIPRNVLSTCCGDSMLYKVSPLHGTPYVVNEHHVLSLKSINNNVINISVTDYLKQSDDFKCIYKGYKVGVEFTHRSVPFDPYLVGKNLCDYIPLNYKTNSRNIRLQVLGGLLDNNGYYETGNNSHVITIKSNVLADDLVFLAQSLGYMAYYVTEGEHYICHIVEKHDLLYDITVEQIGIGKYYGFEIDGNHLFLLGDFTVTHNTTELLRRVRRYTRANKKCIIIKYAKDTRYTGDKNLISTHDGVVANAIPCSSLDELNIDMLNEYDVIAIDEGQFFKDIDQFSDKLANNGKIVIICALNSTYQRKPFDEVSKLFSITENITHLTAICKCGKPAPFTKRISDEEELEVIGSFDKYVPCCRY